MMLGIELELCRLECVLGVIRCLFVEYVTHYLYKPDGVRYGALKRNFENIILSNKQQQISNITITVIG